MFHDTVIPGSHSSRHVHCEMSTQGSDRRHLVHYKSCWHSQRGWRQLWALPTVNLLPSSQYTTPPALVLALSGYGIRFLSHLLSSLLEMASLHTLSSCLNLSCFNCSLSLWVLSLQSASHLRVQVLSWLYYPAHNTPFKVNLPDMDAWSSLPNLLIVSLPRH